MSARYTSLTGMHFGSNPRHGRMGLICSTQYIAIYMYRKAGQKLARIKWTNIHRLEVTQEQVVISFAPSSSYFWLSKTNKITFRCAQVDLLINELLNMKLIKKCDRAIKLISNHDFYKPTASCATLETLDYLVSEEMFQELDPERIPLIEL